VRHGNDNNGGPRGPRYRYLPAPVYVGQRPLNYPEQCLPPRARKGQRGRNCVGRPLSVPRPQRSAPSRLTRTRHPRPPALGLADPSPRRVAIKPEALAVGRLAFAPMHIVRCPDCGHVGSVPSARAGMLLHCSQCHCVGTPKGVHIGPSRNVAPPTNKQTVQLTVPGGEIALQK
jgi:hypothetical protein